MSESAWQLLMIILAPIVFVNLVLLGLLVRAAFDIEDVAYFSMCCVVALLIAFILWLQNKD